MASRAPEASMRFGDRKADALGAAGDDHDPLFQIIDIHDMPLWSCVDA